MNLISRDKNYSQRVATTSNDELGVLIQGFNEMLDQIQDRDQKLLRHGEHLEEQVFLRTEQLSNANHRLEVALKDMATAKNTAESASLAKSQFLAKMSHEIRTPMNGVLGMAELLSNSELNPHQRRYTENVLKSGQALLHIIDDILDLSKIEAGKLEANLSECNLRDIFEDAVELLAEIAYGKGLDIACQLPMELSLVKGDAIRLRQIVHNLTGNAIKFTDKGEVFVNVTIISEDSLTVALRIAVTDTGIGIKEEDQRHIFESFSQVDGSMARKYGGTGLGLTIAKQLVEMMGGVLHVNSRLAAGSTFWFDLRLEKASAAPFSSIDLALAKKRVLIVDPSANQRAVMQYYLEAYRCRTTLVASQTEAVPALLDAAMSGDPYQLCIVAHDVSAAPIVEIAKAIKACPTLAQVKLVTLGPLGRQFNSPELESLIAGAATKPIRQLQFFESLCDALTIPVISQSTATVSRGRPFGLNTRHVLIAEDNPVNREVAIEMLKAMSVTADVAATGTEVLAALDRREYDLILMDCQMPELDGFQTTRTIRKKEHLDNANRIQQGLLPKSLIIVALTANAMSGDRELCLNAGMNDHLSKPFNQQQLATVLQRWLDIFGIKEEAAIARNSSVQSDKVATEPASGVPFTPGPHLDHKILDQIKVLQKTGEESVLSRLVNIYLQSAPMLLADLDDAIRNDASAVIASVAHRLKSSSASLGATNLASLLREIEILGRSKTISGLGELAKQARREYQIIERELEALRF